MNRQFHASRLGEITAKAGFCRPRQASADGVTGFRRAAGISPSTPESRRRSCGRGSFADSRGQSPQSAPKAHNGCLTRTPPIETWEAGPGALSLSALDGPYGAVRQSRPPGQPSLDRSPASNGPRTSALHKIRYTRGPGLR